MAKRPWPKIPPTTLSDWVYQAVRDRILDGDIDPGQFIREQEVTEAMGVSRTPVREAFARLASEGFLERIPHRGFRVPEESFKDLLDLYPIVSALELLAGELALPKLKQEDLAELRQINAAIGEAMQRKDVRASIERNNRFHALICERGGNRRLSEFLADLHSQVTRLEIWYYSSRDHTERSIREHDELIAAAEAGNHARALEVLKKNMLLTYTALLEETGRSGSREPQEAAPAS